MQKKYEQNAMRLYGPNPTESWTRLKSIGFSKPKSMLAFVYLLDARTELELSQIFTRSGFHIAICAHWLRKNLFQSG